MINEKFRSFIPPLTAQEYEGLEESIKTEGCRDPLVLWNGVIVDGHNRYEICQKHGIPFETVEHEFDSEEDALIWMVDNQTGRRNLTDGWRFELIQKKKALLTEKHEAERVAARVSPNDTREPESGRTQKAIAEDLGWSTGKVAQADYVWKHGDEEARESVKSGESSVGQAYKEIKTKERSTEREAKLSAVVESNKPLPVSERKYAVIYADPPWRYEHSKTDSRKIENQYPTMDLGEIKALDVGALSLPDCTLFLWATSPKLAESIEVLESWGFVYRTCAVWDKEKIGMGYYFRQQHELLLVATKGQPGTPEPSARAPSVFRSPRDEHSKKPGEVYGLIESMYPVAPKIELFCRAPQPGWDVWGNQSGA